jgi:hypothetical protein
MLVRLKEEDVIGFELHYLQHCCPGFRKDEQAHLHCVAQMRRMKGFAGWLHS